MRKYKMGSVVVVLCLAVLARPARAEGVPDADVALASRFSDFGTLLLEQKQLDQPDYRACAALLQIAAKLNPDEPRYPRLLVEAYLAANDTDGAIAALKTFRALAPDNQGAQLQLINLNLSKMETVDAKVAYTNQILGANSINADVRSAVAVTCAKLLAERGQQKDADAMLDQAIRLNHLNGEALKLRYSEHSAETSEYEKTQALLQMVQSDPLQPAIVADLAERIAGFGLVKQSIDWFFNGIRLYQRSGSPIPPDFAVDYAAEQFIADRFEPADGMAIQILESDPYSVDALYVRLLCARNSVTPGDQKLMQNLARKTLLKRLNLAAKQALLPTTRPTGQSSTQSTTQSATQPDVSDIAPPAIDPATGLPSIVPMETDVDLSAKALPDLSAAIAKLDPTKDSQAKSQLIGAMSDLAWYAIYFDPQPDVAASLIESLAKLLPAENVTIVRLQGWNYLQQKKIDEAKVKLSAIADRDVMAGMGLVKCSPVTDAAANHRAMMLINSNPSGLVGAFLRESFRDRGIQVVASDKTQAVSQQLTQFNLNWLNIIDRPSDFYLIRGEPLLGQFDYREPLLVRVTIQNLSNFDITLGAHGVIRTDLWMDAEIKGAMNQFYPGTAYDRITQQIVLHSRQSIAQIVRVDQGNLLKLLDSNPTTPQEIFVTVLTNPVQTSKGVGAGPGGYRVQLAKMLTRAGFAIGSDKEVDKLTDNLTQGSIGKISAMDLMAQYVRLSHANPGDERLQKLAPQFLDKLTTVRIDPSASVRGYSMYLSAMLSTPAAQVKPIQEMSRTADWSTRAFAAAAAMYLDADARKAVWTELSNDADPAVKQCAVAMLALKRVPAPTTMPTAATPAPATP